MDIPHPEGSNWFGIWEGSDKFMISNAISAIEEPFFGALAENGDVIYSRVILEIFVRATIKHFLSMAAGITVVTI